jgi:hypothetical protein
MRDEVVEDGENYMIRSTIINTLTKYYQSDKIKKDEMGKACSFLDGGDEKCIQNFRQKT